MRWLAYSRVLTDYHVHLRPRTSSGGRDYFTEANVDRYLAAAEEGGDRASWGPPSTSTASQQALDIWAPPVLGEQAHDDLDAYCEFVRATPLRLGIEMDFVPGREDRIANLLDARRLRLRDRLGPLRRRDGAVDDDGYDVWERTRDPDARLAPLLRDARRGGAQPASTTSSPTRTW